MALSPVTTTFTPQPLGGAFGINAYGRGYVEINGVRHAAPLVLHPDIGANPLNAHSVASLEPHHFESLLPLGPEIVLVGTGEKQVFLSASVLAPLTSKRIGVECMSLGAACRTFNLLSAEGRKVVALLVIERSASDWASQPPEHNPQTQKGPNL